MTAPISMLEAMLVNNGGFSVDATMWSFYQNTKTTTTTLHGIGVRHGAARLKCHALHLYEVLAVTNWHHSWWLNQTLQNVEKSILNVSCAAPPAWVLSTQLVFNVMLDLHLRP